MPSRQCIISAMVVVLLLLVGLLPGPNPALTQSTEPTDPDASQDCPWEPIPPGAIPGGPSGCPWWRGVPGGSSNVAPGYGELPAGQCYDIHLGVIYSCPTVPSTLSTDTQPPTVSWVKPVGNGGYYPATSGTVGLEVSVSDNVGISSVEFLRWDAVNLEIIGITTDSSSPYQASVEVNTLNPEWNQITALAEDTAGNKAEAGIFIYRLSPKITLDSTEGAPGSQVTVQGSGWIPTDTVRIHFAERANEVANVTVDAEGNFTTTFPIPTNAAIGEQKVIAITADGIWGAEAIFRVTEPTEKPPFQFQELPVAFASINYINWYGNTKFAYRERYGIYKDLQGLHSGIDFIAPEETPIKSVVNRTGEVVSIDNEGLASCLCNYRAGPGNLLIDYGDYLVLYGHTQELNYPEKVKLGATIDPNDTIAYVGSDTGGLIHLHLEVIRKNPPGSSRPGDIRTNPVPFFSSAALKQLEDKARGEGATFHTLQGGKWQTPEDQPDITPGKEILIP